MKERTRHTGKSKVFTFLQKHQYEYTGISLFEIIEVTCAEDLSGPKYLISKETTLIRHYTNF